MRFKTKLALITIGVVALVASLLAIRQKYYPSIPVNGNTNIANNAEEEFNQKMITMIKRLDTTFSNTANSNANLNANANSNINSAVDKLKVISDKFGLVLYPQVQIERDLNVNVEKKISTVTLSTKDEKDKVLDFFKQQLTDQAKEIESVNDQADDKLETSLILFSAEGGEGELSVKIWRAGEKTKIDLSMTDNFKDPRQ